MEAAVDQQVYDRNAELEAEKADLLEELARVQSERDALRTENEEQRRQLAMMRGA